MTTDLLQQTTQTIPFSAFDYQRPEMDVFSQDFNKRLADLSNASDSQTALDAFEHINHMRAGFSSLQSLCHIRHTTNTRDKFYETENDFFDQQMPVFQSLNDAFYRLLVQSPHRPTFEQKYGKQLFRLIEMGLRTFDPAILPDLQEENRISSEYSKLKAQARFKYRGTTHNLSSITALEESSDRATRHGAAKAKWRFMARHAHTFDTQFDQLVAVRTRIAKKLGFENFIELGYLRMNRGDYNAAMIAGFRQQVETHIVPLATKLYQWQRKRMGWRRLSFFDEPCKFKNGNPKPQGSTTHIVNHAARMYNEMSTETGRFFTDMQRRELLNLEAADGKAPGGYCTFINSYNAPFIYSNFNGTSADIDVLTHEAGHAFQVWSSQNIGLLEYNWPTYEACEIHSMSMEFFAWPWMDGFFGTDADQYRFAHLAAAIQFLPYGVAVDHFQHKVYQNPQWTAAQRNACWVDMERRYLPHRQYNDHAHLESGRFWQKQSHIYQSPFYYIDYVLAQFCAFQFWLKRRENPKKAWDDYLRLCQAGGSRSFLELVALADLESPFAQDIVEQIAQKIGSHLDAMVKSF
jgi:M3 family oligoendopeptidase